MSISRFMETAPSLESYWRAIILFGRNVASYKFALAKSLLDIQESNIALENLARPYAAHICEHLKKENKQGTSRSSKFLDACRSFNAGEVDEATLYAITEKLGFVNVLDAFHIVNEAAVEPSFFKKYKINGKIYLSITDELFQLKDTIPSLDLMQEAEARWSLVETAWALSLSRDVIRIQYDTAENALFTLQASKRKNVTSARDALNGYQKGKCFYCMKNIDLHNCDVDHFFPHILKNVDTSLNIDGIWNLVLSCPECNRGEHGKFAKVPELTYLERLNTRNDFFISSHHPLRETLMLQTGMTAEARRAFLQKVDKIAISNLIHRWRPAQELPDCF